MTRTTFIAAALALAAVLPAQAAGVSRTFLSAAGSDSNNCANVLTPCRHLATAFAATANDGEIYVLDPANYGSLTITHGVSIEGHGWASIAPVANGNAITINANPGDAINIIGVVLDGTALPGTNGIVFNSGGSLAVADSVVRNFRLSVGNTGGVGILLLPASGPISFVVTNTLVSNNNFSGIFYNSLSGSAAANVVIEHVAATNNGTGITIDVGSGGGPATVAISNSNASNNASAGIFVSNASAPLTVSIDNTTMSGNEDGIDAYGTSNVLLGRSVITANTSTGISNNTSPNTLYSYKDNRINLNNNGSNFTGSTPVMVVQQ